MATFLAAAVFTLPAQLQSQSCLPPDEFIDGDSKKITVTLSKDALRLADDYLEILRQLAELTDAYQECYSAVQIELAGDNQHGLGLISVKLKNGSYFRNIEGLETDIIALRQALVSKEEGLKERDKKAFRLSRSLRQELQALEGLLQQEVVSELRQDLDIAQHVELYLREKEDQANITVLIVGNKDSIIRYPLKKGEAPSVSVNYVPLLPSIPQLTTISIPSHRDFSRGSGGTKVVREFVDSIRVSTTIQPIHITNPIGNLQISGWDHQKVRIQSKVELSAESPSKAKELADLIVLRLYSKDDRIHVDLIVPNLTDPQTKIIGCDLNVKVPKYNPLVCNNSFGHVEIERMHNDVKLTACNSQVQVNGVEGRVEVTNGMGEVELTRISGPIKVTNSYGPIDISRCHGDMEIENAFSSIELAYSEGDVVIRNSGRVDIMRHSGTIHIENKNGQVEVLKLDGDLSIQNAFELLSIEDIFGSAKVKNANGSIIAKNVTGEFSANNSFGRIYGDQLYGPIHLTSHNGSIDVTLAEELVGPSTIDASFGIIKVSVSPHSDLLLMASTVGGEIQSHFQMDINEGGLTKTAKLSFGKADSPLSISGNNSNIIISASR